MRRFTQLFIEMDRTKRTSEKLAAMVRYFRAAPAEDAAWALYFLSGQRLKRLVPNALLDEAIRLRAALPGWLIGESYEAVGDGAELFALLYRAPRKERTGTVAAGPRLHEFVEQRLLTLRHLADPAQQRDLIVQTWDALDFDERLVFNKLLMGNFRVGVAQTLIIRALAEVADVSQAVMAHRFAGKWTPSAGSFRALIAPADAAGAPFATLQLADVGAVVTGAGQQQRASDARAQPYPFFLGYPLDVEPAALGDVAIWQAEWKYDGIRAQIIHRGGEVIIWSRGEELITPAFPEIARAAADLPAEAVLDGEIVAWENEQPLPFALLQRRIHRKRVEPALFVDVPVAFLAFDLLEHQGNDMRAWPLSERRALLESIVAQVPRPAAILVSPTIAFRSWDELGGLRESARARNVEGVMLKRMDGAYQVGRRKGDWWKWKLDPHTVDTVLMYAQGGSGRRAGVYTDYTFGVWKDAEARDPAPPDANADTALNVGGRELVPVAKAYSGLTDDEIREVDRFIRRNTIAKHGPVRAVKPELVFELAFQGVQPSDRHKAALALRFPRINRWRKDKKADEADTIETLRAMVMGDSQ